MPRFPSVLLVGASVRWAAQSAAGRHRVIGMDLFGDQDTIAACDRFQKITLDEQADPAKLESAISKLARDEQATIFRVGGLGCQSVFAPDDLASIARAAGFLFPETYSRCEFKRSGLASRQQGCRWLVKQSGSTGGLGVSFYPATSLAAISPTAHIQRWIPGQPYGVVAMANRGRVKILGITRSIPVRCGGLPFVYAGSRTTMHHAIGEITRLQVLAETIAEQRDLSGLFNIDFIRDRQNRWWLLEVNERPSASCEIIERAARSDVRSIDSPSLITMHIDSVLNTNSVHAIESAIASWDIQSASSDRIHLKRIVYSRRNGHVHLTDLKRAWDTKRVGSIATKRTTHKQLADYPTDNAPVKKGHPIATVLIDSSQDSATVAKVMRRAVGQIQAAVTG
ncbi:ATP-grasp domain-containing protein [Aporhodopirellula aestuarii]|uniref:ATP-grasp domain-containing protein n=1 Tax=Aporhodopirellula aestuarii TaxID=2950107 RepID=A0ABT0U004_9BACT|nr:ATP-grasp domain-containing protein [Aporhodopirellula aestuarii]MCM2370217.1 ATP-grasp domain-containing protein [Aporhodopirellula aestuarii]